MKSISKYFATILTIVAILPVFTACENDAEHENEHGVAVFLDNSQCRDVAIGQNQLFVYNASGDLYTSYNYADAHATASALLPLDAGSYTMVAVANANVEQVAAATLTELREWVANHLADNSNLLSGIKDADVNVSGISLVAIPLQKSAFALPALSIKFTLPNAEMAEFTPTKSRASNNVVRCIAELRKAGSDKVLLHKVITPQRQDDGSYIAVLESAEGNYDLCLWADMVAADAPLADAFYLTNTLNAVYINAQSYSANTDAKDAACGNENNITLPKDGAAINIALQRPLAKYRIVANDVETYIKLKQLEPDNYPPLEDLTVTVQYEGYLPSEFNAKNNTVTDAITGISFSSKLTEINIDAKSLNIASDWILASKESSVTATITVSDSKGNKVSSVSGVSIAYKQGYQTTISGKFLTAGVDVGGLDFDTDWDEIIIEF